jgi:hypothetical protein
MDVVIRSSGGAWHWKRCMCVDGVQIFGMFNNGKVGSNVFVAFLFTFLLFFDAVHDNLYIVVIPFFEFLI